MTHGLISVPTRLFPATDVRLFWSRCLCGWKSSVGFLTDQEARDEFQAHLFVVNAHDRSVA